MLRMEPCSHYGKTPPCVDLILKNNIPEVVIGIQDPHKKVAGKGIEKLLQAGCKVRVGLLEDACRDQHRRFLCYHEKKRPYIILKWAQSADGFIAPDPAQRVEGARPFWITNRRSRQLVHKWRSEEQAILAGTRTILDDNPGLTCREWYGNSPLRVILDRDLCIKGDYQVLDKSVKTIIITQQQVSENDGNALIYEYIDFGGEISSQIADVLFKHKITSVIIEGGARTLEAFIVANLWDEARIFTGPANFKGGLKAPLISANNSRELDVLEDKLKILLND